MTGQTAANIDFAGRLSGALIPYLALIVGLAFLLLMIAFRSILVPLTAVGGFLLTIGAAFGALVAVFQQGTFAGLFGIEQTAPIVSVLPIFIVGILFGLAMDYQVFLVSRMREEHVHGAGPTRAITEGFRHGARVVTGAALIMVGVFAGFIVEDSALIKSIGFALAFGILIDAFVVRMTLIPAVMALLGERAWWLPRWLERLLPRGSRNDQRLDDALRRDVVERVLGMREVVLTADQLRPRELLGVLGHDLDGAVDVADVAAPAATDVQMLLVEIEVRVERRVARRSCTARPPRTGRRRG